MEKIIPFLVATISAGIAALTIIPSGSNTIPPYLPASTITTGIIAAGFAAIQRNTLIGMRGSSVLQFATRTGYYQDVIAYFMHPVYAGLFTSAISLTGLFPTRNPTLSALWLITLTFSIALLLALILRNEILMARIIKRFIEADRKTPIANQEIPV